MYKLPGANIFRACLQKSFNKKAKSVCFQKYWRHICNEKLLKKPNKRNAEDGKSSGPLAEELRISLSDLNAQELELQNLQSQLFPIEIPVIAGGDAIFSCDVQKVHFPHQRDLTLGNAYFANSKQINVAIEAALAAQASWSLVSDEERVKLWRECAKIIENNPHQLIASIVLGQGKILQQAQEDVRRLVTTLLKNAEYLEHLSNLNFEPSNNNVFPTFQLRPLDGFVAACSPYESCALSANSAFSPAVMGNTVLWNPSLECAAASFIIYQHMRAVGLPDGVINFVPANRALFLDTVTNSAHLAGVSYRGDMQTLRSIYKQVAEKINRYNCYPRLVGECYSSNFHFVHKTANIEKVVDATISAAFDYCGQYANSCSCMYVPVSTWSVIRDALLAKIAKMKIGDPVKAETTYGPIANQDQFERMIYLIEQLRKSNKIDFICGGEYCDQPGLYIYPTIVVVKDILDPIMCEPIQGPLLAVYVYPDESASEVLQIVARQSKFALSGSVFALKDDIINNSVRALRMAAGNLYVNERCTGNSQSNLMFGGNRLSGTNDKSGSAYFLVRFCSPQLVEETVDPTVSPCPKCNSLQDPRNPCTCGQYT